MGAVQSRVRTCLYPCFRSFFRENLIDEAEVEPMIHQDFRVLPVPKGSIVNIYKQDPHHSTPGFRKCWLPVDITTGPTSEYTVTKTMSNVDVEGDEENDEPTVKEVSWLDEEVGPSDGDNNYEYDPNTSPEQFDCVNAFAVTNMVINMYRRALNRMGYKGKVEWQWGKEPITIYPRGGEMQNAWYWREKRELRFFYFPDAEGKNIYSCRSFDIIAHETGHAILDGLKPGFYDNDDPSIYPAALHESFGDLTVLLALLNQMDMCEAVVAHSKGDLHNKSFFPTIAEHFAEGLGMSVTIGLRNADNDLAIDEVEEEHHSLSQVYTGAVYDIMADMYDMTRDVDKYNPAGTLYRVGQHMCSILIMALLKAPDRATFAETALKMIELESQEAFKTVIRRQFDRRKVFSSTAKPQAFPNIERVETTMHICGSDKNIAKRKTTQTEPEVKIEGASTEAKAHPGDKKVDKEPDNKPKEGSDSNVDGEVQVDVNPDAELLIKDTKETEDAPINDKPKDKGLYPELPDIDNTKTEESDLGDADQSTKKLLD